MIGIKVDGKFYIHSFDQAIKKNDETLGQGRGEITGRPQLF